MNVRLSESETILVRAAGRGAAKRLSYAGEVTPQEAWQLHQLAGAIIVDVRTEAEYNWVGHVPGTRLIEWKRWRENERNPDFERELIREYSRDDLLLLLCRSAVRSHHAAEAAASVGFTRVYNILEGFEGDLNADKRRGALGGWRKAGLPWEQS
jgi:rhodanese-related sulfurtransferase